MEDFVESPVVSIEPEMAQWRSRTVCYYKGDWTAIQSLLPQFDLKPFTAGKDEPSQSVSSDCNASAHVCCGAPASGCRRVARIGGEDVGDALLNLDVRAPHLEFM